METTGQSRTAGIHAVQTVTSLLASLSYTDIDTFYLKIQNRSQSTEQYELKDTFGHAKSIFSNNF